MHVVYSIFVDMKRLKLTTLLLFFSFSPILAQIAPPANLATIKQNLNGLQVLGSVLYIAAHPDDENTKLLAYLAKEKQYRTGYLSLTRGDGGQNLIGNEQNSLLGLIRTNELLSARKVDGAEQFFTRANDFGFSKNPEETLSIWDKEKVLGDVVWVIRKFRPDVIICRFPTNGQGGHGHHTSSAILAEEAYAAAANPKKFPEQLKYVSTWQAKRLLWNTFSFGSINTTAPDQFKTDVGVYNLLLGKGYGELAAESRSKHQSQGFGSAKQRGQQLEYFKTILGSPPVADLFDGINTSWTRIINGSTITAEIKNIQRQFDAEHPESSVAALVALLTKVEGLPDDYWRKQKSQQIKELIAACSGLWFESYAEQQEYALGDSITIYSQAISYLADNIKLNGSIPLIKNKLQTLQNKQQATTLSQPFWLSKPHTTGTYTLPNDTLAGYALNPNTLSTTFEFEINGKKITYTRPVQYKYTHPVQGEIYQPVEIVPPVTATIEKNAYIYANSSSQTIRVSMKSFTKGSGTIRVKPIKGWKILPQEISFSEKQKGDEWVNSFTVSPIGNQSTTDTLKIITEMNGREYSVGLHRIRYNHIPNIILFPPTQAGLVTVNLKTAGKNIGYFPGAGDKVPEALGQIGYKVHILDAEAVTTTNLANYNAIVIGIRAYNTNEKLVHLRPYLLDYVKNGGNLVVQYNTTGNLLTDNIGPYPFTITNQRITQEDANVTLLDNANPVLNYPNKITPADFDHWIQERGLYFVADADKRYSTPLQMNDTGMDANRGALITTNFGKGRFVYTSLSFFRQLPTAVPGAYRLFVNLLSKPN